MNNIQDVSFRISEQMIEKHFFYISIFKIFNQKEAFFLFFFFFISNHCTRHKRH